METTATDLLKTKKSESASQNQSSPQSSGDKVVKQSHGRTSDISASDQMYDGELERLLNIEAAE